MNTDHEWERWGRDDPYYGVITHERFRRQNLDEQARSAFFESGYTHVEYVFAMCRTFITPDFQPQRVMDFGCGVGRVVIPFAARVAEAVGLDVSPSMLEEARRNCDALGAANVTLHNSGDDLAAWADGFDLVHTCIVLQHVDPARGRQLFAQLLRCVRPGGIGALHVTYAKAWFPDSFGRDPQPAVPPAPPPAPRGLRTLLGGRGRAAEVAAPAPEAAPPDPGMQMYSYDLNPLLFILQTAKVTRFHVDFTDHGGELGVFIFFQRPAA